MMVILFAFDGAWLGLTIGALILGLIGGFFGARAFFKKQLREHPPITEAQIRAMYASMGKKPSEKQVRATMNALKRGGDNY